MTEEIESKMEWILKINILGSDNDFSKKFGALTADHVDSEDNFSTLGVAVNIKRLKVDNQRIRLIMMVCAGEDSFEKKRGVYREESGKKKIINYC